ncbi:hypothetical protein FQZ97_981640 [compost metagenome]
MLGRDRERLAVEHDGAFSVTAREQHVCQIDARAQSLRIQRSRLFQGHFSFGVSALECQKPAPGRLCIGVLRVGFHRLFDPSAGVIDSPGEERDLAQTQQRRDHLGVLSQRAAKVGLGDLQITLAQGLDAALISLCCRTAAWLGYVVHHRRCHEVVGGACQQDNHQRHNGQWPKRSKAELVFHEVILAACP